jgi:hypothetical protein
MRHRTVSFLYLASFLKIMSPQKADYTKEFDETVREYNEWLSSLEPEAQKINYRRAFLRGMDSIFGGMGSFFGSSCREKTSESEYEHPLYSREDLSPEQKDAIALASDFQRADMSLDKIIAGEPSEENIPAKDAQAIKPFFKEMYAHYRNVYVFHARRR